MTCTMDSIQVISFWGTSSVMLKYLLLHNWLKRLKLIDNIDECRGVSIPDELCFPQLECGVVTVLGDCFTQQARVSQEDDIKVEDVLLISIYLGLAEEGARDAEVVGEADAVVDGDRPRAGLDADDALGWLRWPHGLLWRAPLLRRGVRDENWRRGLGREQQTSGISHTVAFRTVVSGGSADICAAELEKIEREVRLGEVMVQKWRSPDDDLDAVEAILVRVSTSNGGGEWTSRPAAPRPPPRRCW